MSTVVFESASVKKRVKSRRLTVCKSVCFQKMMCGVSNDSMSIRDSRQIASVHAVTILTNRLHFHEIFFTVKNGPGCSTI